MTKQAQIDQLEAILDEKETEIDRLRTEVFELEKQIKNGPIGTIDSIKHEFIDFRNDIRRSIATLDETSGYANLKAILDYVNERCVNFKSKYDRTYAYPPPAMTKIIYPYLKDIKIKPLDMSDLKAIDKSNYSVSDMADILKWVTGKP